MTRQYQNLGLLRVVTRRASPARSTDLVVSLADDMRRIEPGNHAAPSADVSARFAGSGPSRWIITPAVVRDEALKRRDA